MSSADFKTASLNEIKDVLLKFDNFFLTGHNNPDGDSIGSVNCLRFALEKLGKNVQTDMCTFDNYCFVQMDVQANYRIPKSVVYIKEKANFTVCIDHHQKEDLTCNLSYIDSGSAANALIVWDLVHLFNIEIDKDIANAAYFGLCSDTNSFMNTNTDKKCFEQAIKMINYGVCPAEICKELFQSRSIKSFQLQKVCLDNMYIDETNRFVLSYLKSSDYEKYNATKADSDACIDYLRQLQCVDVVCVLRQETKNQKIKGSLRSKTDADVSILAKKHIGGGHKGASGLTMVETDMDKAVEIIKQQLVDLMNDNL